MTDILEQISDKSVRYRLTMNENFSILEGSCLPDGGWLETIPVMINPGSNYQYMNPRIQYGSSLGYLYPIDKNVFSPTEHDILVRYLLKKKKLINAWVRIEGSWSGGRDLSLDLEKRSTITGSRTSMVSGGILTIPNGSSGVTQFTLDHTSDKTIIPAQAYFSVFNKDVPGEGATGWYSGRGPNDLGMFFFQWRFVA